MRRRTFPIALAGCLAPCLAAWAQSPHTVLFRGLPASFGTLEQRDLAAGGPPSFPLGARPIRLLPLEVNGRTELTRTDPAQGWRHDDVPGASRVSLPAERGSLFHFEADLGAGVRSFGFFWIDASGLARPAIERNGSGPANDRDPFQARVAASADGLTMLCATTREAGGDLLEVELATGNVIDRTANQPPRLWLAQSLCLAPQWGLAMYADGMQSFRRLPAAQASALSLGSPAPTWYPGDVALSVSGSYGVFVAGSSMLSADVFVVDANGSVARATQTPAAISPAGYLPEQLDGPYLSVSDDGSQCAWRTEGLTREAFLARVPWQVAAPEVQLTSNANFTDTIDEVGQFAFRPNTGLVFSAGERAAPAGGIGKLDVFSAVLPPGTGAPTLQNLSQSSGLVAPPFLLPGAIRPEGAVDVPGGQGRMLLDRATDRLVWLAPQGGPPATVLLGVKGFTGVERSAARWILIVQRTSQGQPHEVVAWDASSPLAPQVLYSSSSADSIDELSVRGDRCAFVERNAPFEDLRACDLITGNVQLFSTRNFLYGPALAIASNGELTANLGAPLGAAVFVRWQMGALPQRLGPTSGPGFVLRGL